MKDLADYSGHENQCRMSFDDEDKQNEGARKKERFTAYYVWLPFLLLISMGLSKLGRFLWKESFEQGYLRKVLFLEKDGDSSMSSMKIVEEMKKLSSKALAKYSIMYVFCEVLNLICVISTFLMFDKVFTFKYSNYGSNFLTYITSSGNNPMCEIFPTVVSCRVHTGGATGDTDISDHICILSNNLFNMYYFLFTWFWWIVLMTVSSVKLVLSVARFFIPSLYPASRNMRSWSFGQLFFLSMLRKNVPEEVFDKICEEKIQPSQKYSESNEEENEMINHK